MHRKELCITLVIYQESLTQGVFPPSHSHHHTGYQALISTDKLTPLYLPVVMGWEICNLTAATFVHIVYTPIHLQFVRHLISETDRNTHCLWQGWQWGTLQWPVYHNFKFSIRPCIANMELFSNVTPWLTGLLSWMLHCNLASSFWGKTGESGHPGSSM
jgi:hypothetical protein